MILIYVKNTGRVYDFPNSKTASLWMKNFSELYSEDLNNLIILSDRPFPNTIEILEEPVDKVIGCNGCGSTLKFTVEPTDHRFSITCPACKTRHFYQV